MPFPTMPQNERKDDAPKQLLPQPRRCAMWDSQSGLIVSPYAGKLPSKMPSVDPTHDPLTPSLLHDQNVYYAFYPQKNWDNGTLFSVLSHPDLSGLIVQVPESFPGRRAQFMLSDDVKQEWIKLENFLRDVADHLYLEHPDNLDLPHIDTSQWPRECGYQFSYTSKADALRILKATLHGFRLLSAWVSMTLALWITEFQGVCFDRPFYELMNRPLDPISPAQLDLLRASVVCTISPGLRPGGFLDPYKTKWARVMFRMNRFCVPFWMIWGHSDMYSKTPLDRHIKKRFFPPDDCIRKAKEVETTYSSLIIPDGYHSTDVHPSSSNPLEPAFDYPFAEDTGTFPSNDDRDPPPAWEESSNAAAQPMDIMAILDTYRTGQRSGETWESFRARMEEGLRKRKEVESNDQRQSREALEANAAKNGYSKKTTVFIWEEDEAQPGFYRRTRLEKKDLRSEFWSCSKHQRFFWGHRKEWDLVPHLPRNPPGTRAETPVEDLEIDDERFNFLYSKAPPLEQGTSRDAEPNVQSSGQYRYPFFLLVDYLKFRHGFSISLIDNWHTELHVSALPRKMTLTQSSPKYALRRLGYGEKTRQQVPVSNEELVAIINFQNICVAVSSKNTRISNLPSTWDLCSNSWVADGHLRLRVQIVKYEQGNTDLYVIRPRSSSWDRSSWYVATTSSTAVLLLFRKKWLTMREIATSFLSLGIPFHTVEERMREDTPAAPDRQPSRCLNVRPQNFEPTEEDHEAYLRNRDEVFKSPQARVLRLNGGIVGRLAQEDVPDVVVLDGPSFCDDLIGTTANSAFLDDYISSYDLDIVSGVYRVMKDRETSVHHSWWPKHNTWLKCGLYGDQWLPNAEQFYAERVAKFREKNWDLKGATSWKESLKYDRVQIDSILGGSEALAKEFIGRCLT